MGYHDRECVLEVGELENCGLQDGMSGGARLSLAMVRDVHQMRRVLKTGIAVLFAGALAGCSTLGGGAPTTSATDPSAPPPSSPSFSDKIKGFFSSSSDKAPQTVANAKQPDLNCPTMDVRQGASTLTIGPTGGDNATMSLKYQGTFVRAARECAAVAGNLVMRVGVEGRIIQGPAGGPGQVDVPVRIAVVDEAPTGGGKTVVTKLVHIPVTIASAQDNPTFSHIEEGLTFPMPKAAELDNYIVYIGFDTFVASQEKPKPTPKAKTKKGTGNTG
jgi:hypothetical protein